MEKKIHDIHSRLQDAKKEMDKTTDDYIKLKVKEVLSLSQLSRLLFENIVCHPIYMLYVHWSIHGCVHWSEFFLI